MDAVIGLYTPRDKVGTPLVVVGSCTPNISPYITTLIKSECMPYGPCGLSERTGGSRCAGPPPITAAALLGSGLALKPRTLCAGSDSVTA